jgi:hypothetical protein
MAESISQRVVPQGFLVRRERVVLYEGRRAIGTVALFALFMLIYLRFWLDLVAILTAALAALSAGLLGAYLGLRLGSRILRGTTRFGYVPAWWRRFGRKGLYLPIVPVLAVTAGIVMFLLSNPSDLPTFQRGLATFWIASTALQTGHLVGLVQFERRSGTGLWYDLVEERPAGQLRGPMRTPVYYSLPWKPIQPA